MIPVLTVPVLNHPELLQRFLDTIDHPIERLYIVDNGGVVQGIRWPDLAVHVHVVDPGYNMGLAPSWNLAIRANVDAGWWVLAQNDIILEPGALECLDAEMTTRSPAPTIVSIQMGNMPQGSQYGVFGLNQALVDKAGWFDENFIPIYFEDTDYRLRLDHLRQEHYLILSSGTHHDNEASWRGDATLTTRKHQGWAPNEAYLERKWAAIRSGEGPVDRWPQPSIERIRSLSWPIPERNNVR